MTAAMNFKQACAYRMLLGGRDTGHNPHGVMTSGETATYDGQAWINWQTAEGLERRGLVRIDRCPPEGADIFVLAGEPPRRAESACLRDS